DIYSNAGTPNIAQRISLKDGAKTILHKAANPLTEYELGETSVFTLKASDGTDLYCRMIKPTHFDPAKKYPVVVYTYGGPHLQLIRNSWLSSANLWMHYMAQQGYLVFSLDGRGSANRGLAFENATFRNLGTLEMEDQLVGAKWLKEQSFVDGNRMAVHGWSFGGFLTTTLMTRSPGTFRVGVAGGPVIDWSMYEIMYTERYMDKPSENPDGYKKANLLNYVENLDGKLLMIHGTSDDVVLWQHSLLYVREAVNKKVLIDYFVYPEHPHNVLGTDRVHLMRKITEYIQLNLAAE
ncbi:MAG TPA: S9 family peptidase, partial [Bacteroidetes bacterium]|nr:S9 family peptidase [Bacteroidota bacterium]